MTSEKVNGSSFDLGNMVPADESVGEFLHLLHPGTGEPIYDETGEPVGINLLGKDSKEYRSSQRAISNRRLNRKGNAAITAERIEAEANEVLAKCTKSWKGIVLNGESLECNFNNAKNLYATVPWVKEQVDEFVAERANFLGS